MFHTQTSINCGAYIQCIPHKHLSDLLNQSCSHSPKMNGLSNNSLFTMIQFMLFSLSIPRVFSIHTVLISWKKQNKALYTLHLYFNIWLSMATAHYLLLWMQKMHTAHTAPSSLFSPSFITFTTDILNNSVSFASLTLTAQVLEMEHPSAERSGKANTLTPSSGKPQRAFLSLLCPAAWIHMSAALLHWQPLYLEDL